MRNDTYAIGVPSAMLRPGLAVMVPAAGMAAESNGHPTTVAYAIVQGQADAPDRWWLDVYAAAGLDPLPQMYYEDEILGVPALGLTMPGMPTPTIEIIRS